jgi:hypothetical protein
MSTIALCAARRVDGRDIVPALMIIGLGILCASTGFAAVMDALTGQLRQALASVAVSERRPYASPGARPSGTAGPARSMAWPDVAHPFR